MMDRLMKRLIGFAVLMSAATLVYAHGQEGSLGKATTTAAATDVYTVNCFDDGEGAGVPSKLFVHVKDRAPKLASLVSVQIVKSGLASALSVDAVDGDAGYSPAVMLAGGAGNYTVLVNRQLSAAKGIEYYSLEYHCENAKGIHAGTEISMSQNQ